MINHFFPICFAFYSLNKIVRQEALSSKDLIKSTPKRNDTHYVFLYNPRSQHKTSQNQ